MPARLQDIPVNAIRVLPQVRTRIDTASIAEIAGSIKQSGLHQPVIVLARNDGFELIAGERRLRGSVAAGRETIPAMVLDGSMGAADTLLVQLTENLQREPLGCVDIARGIRQLMALADCTASEAAAKLGYSPASASRWRKLLELPEEVLAEVEAGKITLSAAYALARVPEPGQQKQLAEEASRGKLSREALARKIRRIQRGAASRDAKPLATFRVPLGNRRTVTVAAPELELPIVVETLETLLAKAKRALAQGLSIEAFKAQVKQHGRRGAEGGAA